MKREDFEKLLFDKFGDNISLSDKSEEIDTRQKADKIQFICKVHGDFENVPIRVLKSKYGCNKCSRKKSREIQKQTMIDKYGADNPMKIKKFQDKAKKTNIEKYGADNPMKNKEVRTRHNKTLIDKYGEEPWKNEQIIKNREKTNLERRGVKYSSQDKSVVDKMKQTNLKRYGCEFIGSSELVKDKIKNTLIEKYGVENAFQSEEVKEKIRRTNLERYGAENPMQCSEIKERLKAKSKESKIKEFETKKRNKSFNTSKHEEEVYKVLLSLYPEVKREYRCSRYPFSCDFYLPSEDLFIELNIHWTHGEHFFDKENEEDLIILKKWQDKAKDSKFYENAVRVWSKNDVEKRNKAIKNNLNYLVFWKNDLSDFYKWVSSKDNRILLPKQGFIKLTDGSSTCTAIAKQYNFYEFYKNELSMWRDNKTYRNEISLRDYIYSNRKKYLGKDKEDLTDAEILGAFKIAGIYNTYSVYNNKYFKQVLDKYKVKSVIDYSSGWGERLLTCAAKNIKYFGIDINLEVVKGHNNIIKDYKLTKQKSIVGDSATIKIDNIEEFDMAFSCPPYYNLEKYTDKGADNLSTYEDFLAWWDKLVKNIGKTKYFAFQMSTEFAPDMVDIVEQNKYSLIETIECKRNVSHLNNKSKYEEKIYVFEGN